MSHERWEDILAVSDLGRLRPKEFKDAQINAYTVSAWMVRGPNPDGRTRYGRVDVQMRW